MRLPNAGNQLVAGLFAEGRVSSDSRETLTVPESAVDVRGLTPSVLRLKGGRTEKVDVVLGAKDDRGALVCHAGCSNARLMRDGWPLATRRLWIRTTAGRRRVSLSTIAVQGSGGGLFLHVLRNGEEIAEGPAPEPPSLTRRQSEILALIAEGVPAKVIAVRLKLSETTVRNHIRGILSRLGAHSQLEAVAAARRFGVIP